MKSIRKKKKVDQIIFMCYFKLILFILIYGYKN